MCIFKWRIPVVISRCYLAEDDTDLSWQVRAARAAPFFFVTRRIKFLIWDVVVAVHVVDVFSLQNELTTLIS